MDDKKIIHRVEKIAIDGSLDRFINELVRIRSEYRIHGIKNLKIRHLKDGMEIHGYKIVDEPIKTTNAS